MKTSLATLASVFIITMASSCYYDKADLLYPPVNVPCDTSAASKFSVDVLPVMNSSCNSSGCHNTTSASAGVILDTYNGVKAQATNGRLMGSIKHSSGYSAMPKGGTKLNACTIAKIQRWVTAGAPNN